MKRVKELSRSRRARRSKLPGLEGLEPRALLAAGPLGMNVEIGDYTSLVNWLQLGGRWGAAPGHSGTITLNTSGDPTSDAQLIFDYRVNQFFNGPDPMAIPLDLSGTYHLTFNGQATITPQTPSYGTFTQFTVQNQAYNPATNTTTAALVVPAGQGNSDLFNIIFTKTQATPAGATDTGFSNARLIRPGYAADSTQIYTDQFLAALKPYGTLRYLGPDNANGQPFFNGNTLVTVNASQVNTTGTPWIYPITLANQTHTDMWINIPEGATNDYVQALANVVKNGDTIGGVAYPGLDPGLMIYLEYSNEVWGGIPFNEYYQEAAVQNSADNKPLSTFPSNAHVYDNADGSTLPSTDAYTASGRRYLERTADISTIFQGVLGADPTHQRIRPVLGWQENNYAYYPAALGWYEHFFGPASSAFYGLGNATYWNPTDYSSVDSIISTLRQQEQSYAIPNAVDFTTLATYYGMKNVSYEGGPSIGAGDTAAHEANALAASRDPRMEQLVYQHYVDYFGDGGGTANYFDGPYGIWSPQNEWAAAEDGNYGNPTASPKYKGTVDVANAAPVAVTAGVHVAASGTTTFSAATDSLGQNFSNPGTGSQAYYLLNTATAGIDDLQLVNSGAGTAQIKVLLNDHTIETVSVPASSTVNLGNLVLPSGLSTLSLAVVSGQFQPTNFTLTRVQITAFANAGFESPNVGTGRYRDYLYDPTNAGWTFTGAAGVAGNGSIYTQDNPNAPEGTQVGFVQGRGAFSQSLADWPAGAYTVQFEAAQRGNRQHGGQDFQVLVDGLVVGTFRPSGTSYLNYKTSPFTVTAGSHTVTFSGLDTTGGYNTAFIDKVSIVPGTLARNVNPGITYQGTWFSDPANPGYLDGTTHSSITPGDSSSFTFNGTSIAWLGVKNFNHGIVSIYLDGTLVAPSVDTYSPTLVFQQRLYSATGLAPGQHNIKVVLLNQKNAASSGYYTDVNGFVYS